MRKIKLFFCILLISKLSLAQKQDGVWIFGDHAGIDFNDTSSVISFYSPLNGLESIAPFSSISRSNGSLLFFTAAEQINLQGTRVFNLLGQIMLNGDSLQGHPAQTQGLLILPFPADTSLFYIFHKTQYHSKNILYYSIVDMKLDGGLGAVTSKNVVIPCDSLTQRITAVKHANGRDWWLIQQRWDQDEYLKFLITPDGIQGPFKQPTANPNPKEEIVGTSRFSRSGNKLVSVGAFGNINLMDFDRCTGDLSNYQRIGENIFSPENAYIGCEFSPDEKVLYVANSYPFPAKFVYQYDLTAVDIKASKQTVYTYLDTGLLQNITIGHLLLGDDNKIYVAKGNGSGSNSNTVHTQNIDVILDPNIIGQGCNYRSNYLYLNGGRVTLGLPNMVNYSLGPVVGSVCDSLHTGINQLSKNNPFVISPNPVRSWINIYQKGNVDFGKSFHVSLFNNQGQLVLTKEMPNGEYSVSVSGLSEGVYFLQVTTKNAVFSAKVVKIDDDF